MADSARARGFLDRLTAALLTRQERELPFSDQLPHLEQRLVDRQALLGVDPETDLAAILTEVQEFTAGQANAGADGPSPAADAPRGTIGDEPFQPNRGLCYL